MTFVLPSHTRVWLARSAVLMCTTAIAFMLLTPAAHAHPFIRGGEAPVDSLAELALAMAHGCGTETTAGGDPTREVALEVPASMRIVDVPQPDGWEVELERDGQGRVGVVTWRATTAVEPAPDFDFSAVIAGTPGDELHMAVFQACDGFAYRWIGTPDSPAADPAVRLTLAEPDPARPAPPDPEPESESAPELEPQPPNAPDSDGVFESDKQADMPETDGAMVDSPTAADDADAGTDGLTRVPLLLIGAALVVLVGGGLWWWRRG